MLEHIDKSKLLDNFEKQIVKKSEVERLKGCILNGTII